ncbi:cytoplasmic protein [Desulfocarbo indianensis]|nr:cytoplasmic protein [Desulfocarbo indianensis]
MPQHTHEFVEDYDGMVGYGLDRETDQATLQFYLQKFSDDAFMKLILPRLRQEDMDRLFDLLSGFLRQHLEEEEYHQHFLKDHGHED